VERVTTPATPVLKLPPNFDKLRYVDGSNVEESKPSVLYLNPPKKGKSHCLASWPKREIVFSAETNNQTIEGFIGAGADIKIYPIDSWQQWADVMLPAIVTRSLDCESVGLEGVAFLTNMMFRELQGGKANLSQQDFGVGKNKLIQAFTDLTSATHPRPGKRSYNIVATCHTKYESGDTGTVMGSNPEIMGAFKGILCQKFGTVLAPEIRVNRPIVDGRAAPPQVEYYCRTKPLNPMEQIGDGVGGAGKKYRELPPEVDGTYEGLMRAWRGEQVSNTK
jgi:hypothetical protein